MICREGVPPSRDRASERDRSRTDGPRANTVRAIAIESMRKRLLRCCSVAKHSPVDAAACHPLVAIAIVRPAVALVTNAIVGRFLAFGASKGDPAPGEILAAEKARSVTALDPVGSGTLRRAEMCRCECPSFVLAEVLAHRCLVRRLNTGGWGLAPDARAPVGAGEDRGPAYWRRAN